MECRLRAALLGVDNQDVPMEIDMNEAYTAMGNVMGEMLAHAPAKTAKRFTDYILDKRKEWMKHPRVVTQNTQGSA
jgi:hypothetical protein